MSDIFCGMLWKCPDIKMSGWAGEMEIKTAFALRYRSQNTNTNVRGMSEE